ncbi:hypothetical protein Pan153_54410 [Gimesia panareensis]|uniref:Uncharacterized protein n=1 Tax=Gimesia panareensis TaxID=2527978 RepID=A0A518FWJ9_9PLAN|nr:hypothetical protein [Gimesia panareensis]QDV20763.1 hypothetical protein Pan153_54410 [Gimesia panareensis]
MNQTLSEAVQVNVIDCVDEVDDPEFVNSVMADLQTKILDHLQQAPDYFKNAELQVKHTKCISRFYLNEIRCHFAADITGQINGQNYEFQKRVVGRKITPREETLTSKGFIHLPNMVKSIQRGLSTDYDPEKDYVVSPSNILSIDSFFDLIDGISVSLDQFVSRQPGELTRRWKKIQTSRWIIAGLSFFLWWISLLLVDRFFNQKFNHEEGYWEVGFAAVGLAVVTFVIIHCCGYLIMPGPFYRVETAGKRVLQKTGQSSVLALKLIVLLILGFIGLGLAVSLDLLLFHR